MVIKFVRYFIQFILLVVVQVLLVNNIQLGGLINPYIYILLILSLPFDTPGWLLLVVAFALGLSVDVFMNTMGMNAAASLVMAFARPTLLKIMSPRDGYEFETSPIIPHMGLQWFATYAGILILIHHSVLFIIEAGRFSEMLFTFAKVFLSAALSLILIIIIQYLFSGTTRK